MAIPAFPLYDTLLATNVPGEEAMDWALACSALAELPIEHLEILCALIIHHATKETRELGRRRQATPYGGKTFEAGKGVTFHLSLLPATLQKILYRYILNVVVFV